MRFPRVRSRKFLWLAQYLWLTEAIAFRLPSRLQAKLRPRAAQATKNSSRPEPQFLGRQVDRRVLQSGFRGCRDVGEGRHTLRRGDGYCAQLAGADLRRRRAEPVEHEGDMACNQVLLRRARAAIGHMLDFRLGPDLEQFSRKIMRSAGAGGVVGEIRAPTSRGERRQPGSLNLGLYEVFDTLSAVRAVLRSACPSRLALEDQRKAPWLRTGSRPDQNKLCRSL